MILLYWSIGREISGRFGREEWGGKIVDRLARDLQSEFPEVEGFSARSLRYMRAFAEGWPDESILQQVAAKLPWGHHMVLLDRVNQRAAGMAWVPVNRLRPARPTLQFCNTVRQRKNLIDPGRRRKASAF